MKITVPYTTKQYEKGYKISLDLENNNILEFHKPNLHSIIKYNKLFSYFYIIILDF